MGQDLVTKGLVTMATGMRCRPARSCCRDSSRLDQIRVQKGWGKSYSVTWQIERPLLRFYLCVLCVYLCSAKLALAQMMGKR